MTDISRKYNNLLESLSLTKYNLDNASSELPYFKRLIKTREEISKKIVVFEHEFPEVLV